MENQTIPAMPEMTTEAALEMMMKILPDAAAIMNDKEAEPMLTRLKGKDAGNVEAGDAMNVLIPLFASKYKPQLYNIVAAFTGHKPEEIGAMKIAETMQAIVGGLKVTNGFFGCCLRMVRSM